MESQGNPDGRLGGELFRSSKRTADARRVVAATIHAAPEEIIFTGSASEANNQVLKALADRLAVGARTSVPAPLAGSFGLYYPGLTLSGSAGAAAGTGFRPKDSRTFDSISAAMSGFSLRNSRVLSLPWPIFSPL